MKAVSRLRNVWWANAWTPPRPAPKKRFGPFRVAHLDFPSRFLSGTSQGRPGQHPPAAGGGAAQKAQVAGRNAAAGSSEHGDLKPQEATDLVAGDAANVVQDNLQAARRKMGGALGKLADALDEWADQRAPQTKKGKGQDEDGDARGLVTAGETAAVEAREEDQVGLHNFAELFQVPEPLPTHECGSGCSRHILCCTMRSPWLLHGRRTGAPGKDSDGSGTFGTFSLPFRQVHPCADLPAVKSASPRVSPGEASRLGHARLAAELYGGVGTAGCLVLIWAQWMRKQIALEEEKLAKVGPPPSALASCPTLFHAPGTQLRRSLKEQLAGADGTSGALIQSISRSCPIPGVAENTSKRPSTSSLTVPPPPSLFDLFRETMGIAAPAPGAPNPSLAHGDPAPPPAATSPMGAEVVSDTTLAFTSLPPGATTSPQSVPEGAAVIQATGAPKEHPVSVGTQTPLPCPPQQHQPTARLASYLFAAQAAVFPRGPGGGVGGVCPPPVPAIPTLPAGAVSGGGARVYAEAQGLISGHRSDKSCSSCGRTSRR